MEGSRVVILVFLLLFIFFTPDQPGKRRLWLDRENLQEERQHDLEILANSTYGDLQDGKGLNLTGFRGDDGYFWNLLSTVQSISRKQYESVWQDVADRAVYQELNGEIRGDFRRLSVLHSNPDLNATALDPGTEYITDLYQRNVTDDSGQLTFSLADDDGPGHGRAKEIRASLTIESESAPGSGWVVPMIGIHFMETASIVLTSASNRFDAIAALPQFTLSEGEFNASKQQVNATVDKLWHQYLTTQPDRALFSVPSCELIVWLQPKPIAENSRYLSDIEDELQHPEGAPIGNPPPLAYSAVVFSPDCGYVLEAETITGPKREAYWNLVRRLLIAFALAVSIQIVLLKRQMEKAATPSTRSRISYHCIGIAALGDGLFLMAVIALLMTEGAAFLLIAAVAFLCCIHVAFLEVKFIFDIWTVQVGDPSRAEQERRRRTQPAPNPIAVPRDTPQAPASVPAVVSTDGTAGLPLPVTAPRPDGATPIILPSDQDTTIDDIPSPRASFAAIYSKFYFALVLLMFLSLWATSWPHLLRAIYANLLCSCYLSLWVPQIYRNIMRNCRKALSWEYVLGSSLLRTIPILYWYVADHNVLSIETNRHTALIFLAWVWLQVAVLVSQELLGPRTFVKASWCPPAYDYHPVLREDDLEAGGMPIGALASASEAKDKDDKTRKVFDCAICMNEINVPVVSKNEVYHMQSRVVVRQACRRGSSLPHCPLILATRRRQHRQQQQRRVNSAIAGPPERPDASISHVLSHHGQTRQRISSFGMLFPLHRFGDSIFGIPMLLLFRLFYHAAPLDLGVRSTSLSHAKASIDVVSLPSTMSMHPCVKLPERSMTARDHRALFGPYNKISTATFFDQVVSNANLYANFRIVSVTWIKALASPLSHEFLQFVVEDRASGLRNRVAAERHESGDWVYIGWDWSSRDDISHHHLLPLPLVSLEFDDPETSPSLRDFAKVMRNVGIRCPKYVLLKENCWWFAEAVFEETRAAWSNGKIKEWDWSRFRYSFIVRTDWMKRNILVSKAEEFKECNRKTMDF